MSFEQILQAEHMKRRLGTKFLTNRAKSTLKPSTAHVKCLQKKLQSSTEWKITIFTTMRMFKLWKSSFDFCTLCCSLLYWPKSKQTGFCNVSIIRQSIGVIVRKVRTFTLISMTLIPKFTIPKVYEHWYNVIETKYELSVVSYAWHR